MVVVASSVMTMNAQDQFTMAMSAESAPYNEAKVLAEKFKKSSNQAFKGLFSNGFFIDAIGGFGPMTISVPASQNSSLGGLSGIVDADFMSSASIRFGNKWYLSQGEKFRTGIQAVWLRLGTLVPLVFTTTNTTVTQWLTCAPLNIGSTNLIAFNENIGLEINFNIGLNANASFTNVSRGNQTLLQFGVMINPVVKFRYKKFAVGLDFAFTHAGPGAIYESAVPAVAFPYNTDVFQVAITVGGKF